MRVLAWIILWLSLSVNSASASYLTSIVCALLPAFTGAVTSSAGSCATSISSGATLTDPINQDFHVSTATLTATSNTTLAVVTGLSQTLTAGKTYNCQAHLTGTSGASGGIKAALTASGGLTVTSVSTTGLVFNGATIVAQTTGTVLGNNVVASTAIYTDAYITGAIVVNVGGTYNVSAAQNASNVTSTTVLLNSTFSCVRVN